MKIIRKIVTVFSILLLFFALTSASVQNNNIFEYYSPDITVEFPDDNNLSNERKQIIADNLAGIVSMSINPGANQNNIICSLFGHSLSTSNVSATHHKVYKYAPRCRVDYYEVTYCTRCDYGEELFLGSEDIFCHPEDLIN